MPERAEPRLLICDDSAVERNTLAKLLQDEGYLVEQAGDGATGISHLKSLDVDLILLDLNMPGSDGFDVLDYVQEHRRNLPVLLMSGMSGDGIQRKMHRHRTRDLPPLILKPIDPEQLLTLVELALAGELPATE